MTICSCFSSGSFLVLALIYRLWVLVCTSVCPGFCGSLLPVFGVSLGNVSPYVGTGYFTFGLGCLVATFWKKAAYSVNHITSMFSLYFDYL